MKHLLLYFYITSFLIFSNCYISNDNIAITNPKNTLVLITADHETGGYGITGGNTKTNTIHGDFLNDDHTSSMVPIFAFGPGAENFIGTYHNTDVYYKILSSFQIEN